MKNGLLKEDNLPPKLFVAFSSKVRDQISQIPTAKASGLALKNNVL